MECYGQSKLANHLFARALARRLEGTGVTANSLHPGVIATNIFHTLPPLLRGLLAAFVRPFMKSVGAGAATTCYLATAPALAAVTGVYFSDCNPTAPGRNMENDVLAEKLWAVSETLTRPYLRWDVFAPAMIWSQRFCIFFGETTSICVLTIQL